MPVVRVSWSDANNPETRRKDAHGIRDSIVRNTGADAGYGHAIFGDVEASDWAGGGKLFG